MLFKITEVLFNFLNNSILYFAQFRGSGGVLFLFWVGFGFLGVWGFFEELRMCKFKIQWEQNKLRCKFKTSGSA